MKKIIGVVVAFVVVVALGFAGWLFLGRDPMAFAGGSTVALEDYKGGNVTGVPAQLASADLVKRGEYLIHAADCQACHTAPGGAPFAGGFAFNMPFGTIYSTNITPDKQTGIGNYTDAQFLAAMHKGIRADGENLYPAMPYASYAYMTDDDALAIKAYLFTLAPVRARPGKTSFPGPSTSAACWRSGTWCSIPMNASVPTPARARNGIEAPILPRRWAIAANAIPRATSPSRWTTTANSPAPSPRAGAPTTSPATRIPASGAGATTMSISIFPPVMPTDMAARRAPWAKPLTTASAICCRRTLHALVTYLRSVPAHASDLPRTVTTPAPASYKEGLVADADSRGEKIFAGACASCHDWTGVSPVTGYATLTGVRAVNDPSATNVAQAVIHGVNRKTAEGRIFMPAFGEGYSDDDIAAVANYVTARFGAKGAHLTAKDVADLRKQAAQQPNSQEAPNG